MADSDIDRELNPLFEHTGTAFPRPQSSAADCTEECCQRIWPWTQDRHMINGHIDQLPVYILLQIRRPM
jgi:hypothetical protein